MRVQKSSILNLVENISLGEHLKRYMEIKRSGTNAVSKCPFHQDSSPSLYIYSDHYHCFACKAHGNIIDYEMHRTGQGFKECVESLARTYRIHLEYDSSVQEEKNLELREITQRQSDFLERCHGFFKKNFPLPANQTYGRFFTHLGNTGTTQGLRDFFSTLDPSLTSSLKLISESQGPGNPPVELSFNTGYEQISEHLAFPIYKESGRLCGFLLKPEQNDDSFYRMAFHRFLSVALPWQQARVATAQEKYLLVTHTFADAMLLFERGFQNTVVCPQNKLDTYLAKNFSKKVDRVFLVLPLTRAGKAFAWQTFQSLISFADISVYVQFIHPQAQQKSDFILKQSSEHIQKWIFCAEKLSQKITELMLSTATQTAEKISLFQKKILPVLNKIEDRERKKAILLDIAKRHFNTENIDIFFQKIPDSIPAAAAVEKNADPKPPVQELKSVLKRATVFYHRLLMTESGKEAKQYLLQRGLTEEQIVRWQFGYCPTSTALANKAKKGVISAALLLELGLVRKGKFDHSLYDFYHDRIILPIHNHAGEIVALAGRIFKKDADEKTFAKYINSPENALFAKSEILYHFSHALKAIHSQQFVIVVEGYFDCISLANQGIENVVAVMGSALTTAHLSELFKVTKRILICFDADNAGQNAAKRSFVASFAFPDLLLEYIDLKTAKDPDELVQTLGKDGFLNQLTHHTTFLYEKVVNWIAQKSRDQEDLKKNIELELGALFQGENGALRREVSQFLQEKYNLDGKHLAHKGPASKRETPALPVASPHTPTLTSPAWAVKTPLEVKLLMALVHAPFDVLPQRLRNVILNQHGENEEDERICALSLQSQISPLGFETLLELCSVMTEEPGASLLEGGVEKIKNLSPTSQIMIFYASGSLEGLMPFGLQELLRDSLSTHNSMVLSRDLWDTRNSNFLKFQLRNIKLACQSGVLTSFLADALLQIEVDYIDSSLKTFSSFHFDSEVDAQFRYLVSERERRRRIFGGF